jgi:hypothetical protein
MSRGRRDDPRRGRANGRERAAAPWLLTVLLCVAASVPTASRAQEVGNPPERSPYRDIINHQSFTLFGGRFAGNAGAAGVGALPGAAFGGRLAIRLSGPVEFWATVGEAASSRHVIIADTSVTHTDSAKRGSDLRLPLVLADLALVLNVTGDKTWHRLAPYVGLGLGFVAPTHTVTDPGGYQVGFNFALVPTVGTRWFLSDALALRLEVRDYYFRQQFPLAYFDTQDLHYAGPPPRSSVLPLGTTDRRWVNNLTLWVGVAYGFTF